MLNALDFLFHAVSAGILAFFLLINTFYLLFVVLSLVGLFRYQRLTSYVRMKEIFSLPLAKPISIIVPAYNEGPNILESVRSLLALEYPLFEVIVVNDGSTDGTLAKLIEAFELRKTNRVFRRVVESAPVRAIYVSPIEPKLVVIDKVNGKKADAMNAGLNVARYPLFCALDADSILDRDALLKVIRPFHEDPERTVGVGGIIRVSNGCVIKRGQVHRIGMPRNILARFQVLEYIRAFFGGRMGMSMMNCLLIISGAFGVFRKDIALEVGGYRSGAIGEDIDLVIRLRRYLHDRKIPYRITFIPDPVCWTEGPEKLKTLAGQRNRWHRGLIEVLMLYRKMIFNPRYGTTGMLAMPFYLIFEMMGPFVELLGYVIFVFFLATGQLNSPFAVRFFLLAVVYGMLLSLSALLIEEFSLNRFPRLSDIVMMAVFAILENIVYRQWLVLVRVKAFYDLMRGNKGWGTMEKKGFTLEHEQP
ncbi:MAG TPA: glycosyltransferase [Terriglobales bacterium]|nr:glycosyltransferase [Terriglobales bacterium]